ncbi:hypothetical protein JXO59_07115 [candidate division KSB1 bacterium]|nr:hypothetical protein [candidate division KSB1 bacterium]
MGIKELTIEEIKKLDSTRLMVIYDVILSMRAESENGGKKNSRAYLNVRESLKTIQGALSDDILQHREDRL